MCLACHSLIILIGLLEIGNPYRDVVYAVDLTHYTHITTKAPKSGRAFLVLQLMRHFFKITPLTFLIIMCSMNFVYLFLFLPLILQTGLFPSNYVREIPASHTSGTLV